MLPPLKQRDLAHWMIRTGIGQHSGFMFLSRVGDETSVPLIIEFLFGVPKDSSYCICTCGHAFDALEAITNQNPGRNYESWVSWNEQNNHKSQ